MPDESTKSHGGLCGEALERRREGEKERVGVKVVSGETRLQSQGTLKPSTGCRSCGDDVVVRVEIGRE